MRNSTGTRDWRLLPTLLGFAAVLSVILYFQAMTQKNKVARALLRRGDPFPGAKRLRENVASE